MVKGTELWKKFHHLNLFQLLDRNQLFQLWLGGCMTRLQGICTSRARGQARPMVSLTAMVTQAEPSHMRTDIGWGQHQPGQADTTSVQIVGAEDSIPVRGITVLMTGKVSTLLLLLMPGTCPWSMPGLPA